MSSSWMYLTIGVIISLVALGVVAIDTALEQNAPVHLTELDSLNGNTHADTVTIIIPEGLSDASSGKTFQPEVIKLVIGVNNTVRWINQDTVAHRITADIDDDPDFQAAAPYFPTTKPIGELHMSNTLQRGESFEYTFNKPGEFGYHSKPWARGKVIVLPDPNALTFRHSFCATGYMQPSGSICQGAEIVTAPQKFNMSNISIHEARETITLYGHYFGANLDAGDRIVFSIYATAPVDFQLVFSDIDEIDGTLGNTASNYGHTLINKEQIVSLQQEMNVNSKGLYIFMFNAEEPKPVSTVTFEAYYR